MNDNNLIIVGYDFGYNYATYYVKRKDENISYSSDLRIAKSINSMVTENDLGSYEVNDVAISTNVIENNEIVSKSYAVKQVKLFSNYKCTRTTSSGTKLVKYVKPKVFYPACTKVNVICSSTRGGVVSALTVCNQSL